MAIMNSINTPIIPNRIFPCPISQFKHKESFLFGLSWNYQWKGIFVKKKKKEIIIVISTFNTIF